MVTVLIGTTNPSKVDKYRRILGEDDYSFVTPADLGITGEPEESGSDPVENAVIKARFYGRFHDRVICMDSGLFLTALPPDDPRQPKLHVRTPEGVRLGDEEMIAYYSALAASLGGRTPACWLDGTAVYCRGRISTIAEPWEAAEEKMFWLVDSPSPDRHEGWPLDSISIYADTGEYFTCDEDRHALQASPKPIAEAYRERLRLFLISALK